MRLYKLFPGILLTIMFSTFCTYYIFQKVCYCSFINHCPLKFESGVACMKMTFNNPSYFLNYYLFYLQVWNSLRRPPRRIST